MSASRLRHARNDYHWPAIIQEVFAHVDALEEELALKNSSPLDVEMEREAKLGRSRSYR
jgi:hypothetical protein